MNGLKIVRCKVCGWLGFNDPCLACKVIEKSLLDKDQEFLYNAPHDKNCG